MRSVSYDSTLQSIIMSRPLLLLLTIISSRASSSPLFVGEINSNRNSHECHPLGLVNTVCSRWYHTAQLPNLFGHDTLLKAQTELNNVIDSKIPSYPSDEVISFMCIIYLPPCSVSHVNKYVPLPCRATCEAATVKLSRDTKRNDTGRHGLRLVDAQPWPVTCHTLPSQRCYLFERGSGVTFVKDAGIEKFKGIPKVNEIAKVASIEAELGDVNNEGYDLEVVSLSTNQDHGRRYDITDLGDPDLFQGWADVQGTGSANDYCRVVGRSKRRFLSCHLSGNANQGHHYVSKLGFEIGYSGTWFMRDMDGDGRDDYCRCVGSPTSSKVTCMKAGPRGFHGSPMQPGSQHTFALTSSTQCYNRRVNSMFGE